ncbi:protein-disulfide reductase DsbD domain-containing protein [Sphingobacterium sp. xlx-130]|uniref:protein-disulfide reductase DsbD domain-containing protein n=1 Tax=Sphingobacterium sp. xlx-130 TaxID=2654323 RepID=UPI0013DB67C9|nr:protein-disulfide reductase DsbD domain-containing protein [Sphingobacterium sp. xlx-130]
MNSIKNIITSICLFFVCQCAFSQQVWDINVYKLKSHGDDQLKIRVGSNYDSVKGGKIFRIGFFFDLGLGWYTYNNEPSDKNPSTNIQLKLPEGFEVVNIIWPKANNEHGHYTKDFLVIYEIQASKPIPEKYEIEGNASWQVCDGNICNMNEVFFDVELKGGKNVKSKTYKILNK